MAQTPWTGLLAGSSSPLLATGDVLAWVDISDTTQSPSGSLVKTTVASWYAAIPTPINITSASATSFAVGRLGSTTPAFTVDSSTASQVAGLKVTGAATGGTVAVVVTDSGAAANLTVNALGTGTIGIGSVSTGRVTITPVTTITGSLTLSGSGTVTVSAPIISGTQTWNDGAVTFTAFKINVTATASAGASLVADLQVGGATVFKVDKNGTASIVSSNSQALSVSTSNANAFARITSTAAAGTAGIEVNVNAFTQGQIYWDQTGKFYLANGDGAGTTTDRVTVTPAGLMTVAAGVTVTDGPTSLTTTASAIAVTVAPTHASYASTVLALAVTRASSSAFNFLDCTANSVSQFKVTGGGTLTSAGTGTFANGITSTTGDITATAGTLVSGAAAASVGAGKISYGATTQTTIGANGGASALTANPVGYIIVNIAGTNRIIPYYTA